MRVLSIRFRSSIPLEKLQAPFLAVARDIAAVPGLISKVWIRDNDLLGGLYLFRDQASLEAYAGGPIVADIKKNPGFSDFRIEQYDALEDLSAITRGVAASVGV